MPKKALNFPTLALMMTCVMVCLAVLASILRAQAAPNGSYSTSFPVTENPVSEGGVWINGKTTGLDWADVATTPGRAYGLQPGNSPNPYNDATAVLTGTWSHDQQASATVYVVSAPSPFAEVELRLRTSISAHSITGYEFNCSVVPSDGYMQIVRWNGPLGSFTLLDSRAGGCTQGDVLSATAVGTRLSIAKNGVTVFSVTDGTFSVGSPGVGVFLQNQTGINANYGFTQFAAANFSASPPPPPASPCTASPLNVTVSQWPSASMGSASRRLTYSDSGPASLASITLQFTPTRQATFTDTRGCTAVVH
jgi:hypothetical protein